MEKYTMTKNGHRIDFELHRKNVKNINLNIRSDLSVMISANSTVPIDIINDFVKKKFTWILKNLSNFKDTQAYSISQKEYVSGESFKYLGKQLRLKVREAEVECVNYTRGYLNLSVKKKDNYSRKKDLVCKWFKKRTDIVFAESLEKTYKLVEKYEIKKPKIMIRIMKARWGSCAKDKGLIVLNADLIKAPKYCIDYVVLHELLHFKHRNHDKNFYNIMTVLMPDWKTRKKILDEEVVRHL